MKAVEPEAVDPEGWRQQVADRVADGYAWLDFLTAIDRRDTLDVLVRLVDPRSASAVVLVTTVPVGAAVLDTVSLDLPGAQWYEREAAEMFGIQFVGHPDPRPLLTRGDGPPPLRKTTPLAARVETAWPGAEPDAGRAGSRRRAQPPGVLETWESS